MKVCQECETARVRVWHGYRASCPDCVVRQLAMSPRHIRDAAYEHAQKNVGEQAAHLAGQLPVKAVAREKPRRLAGAHRRRQEKAVAGWVGR